MLLGDAMFIPTESRKNMRGYSYSREDFIELLVNKYFTMEKIENGCIGTGEQATDYVLSEGFGDSLPNLYQQDDIYFEYNQYKQTWSKKSCSIFAAVGAISDLFNYQFSLAEIKEIDDLSYTRGRIKDSGWYVQAAVKLVADWWNEHKKEKVAYYRLSLSNDELVKDILDKGYTIVTNYNGNNAYNKDYSSDLVLNGVEFGKSTYGHVIDIRKINGKRSVKDNAAGTSANIYELEHTLREIKCYSYNGYIYTKVAEDNLEEIKRLNELKTECLNCITSLGKIRHMTNDTNFQGVLHYTADKLRAKVKDCDDELKKYI